MTCLWRRTVRQMVDDTLRLVGDFRGSGLPGKRHAWDEARDAVRDTVMDFARDSWALRDICLVPVVAGVSTYDLPAKCLEVVAFSLSGVVEGRVIFPSAAMSMRVYDYAGARVDVSGTPESVFRNALPFNQFGIFPTPSVTGATFSQAEWDGVLATVSEADGGQVVYESEDTLVGVTGVPYLSAGDDPVVSELWPTLGDVVLVYIREPLFPDTPDGYIDAAIPPSFHKDVKYGAAARLLRRENTLSSDRRADYFFARFRDAVAGHRNRAARRGAVDDVRPL